MTHDGRMTRGKANVEKNILLNNEDTKYYLENSEKVKEDLKEDPKAEKKEKKLKEKK